MTTTLPPIQNVQVATVPLAAFLSRQAAILAAAGTSTPLPEINFLQATVLVGDGNVSGSPQCPSISTLQSTNALTHQLWSGKIVQSATQNVSNPNQIDLLCVIPAVDANGNEIGPFWVTEFVITDENGTPMIAGVTAAPKFTVANGGITDLSFVVSIAFAVGAVVLTAPAEPFLSKSAAQTALSNIVTGAAPIAVAKSTDANGWEDFQVQVWRANQPADPISNSSDVTALGVGRAASAAEFAAGVAASAAGFKLPWPTIAQVRAYVDGLTSMSAGAPGYMKFRNGLILQYGGGSWAAHPGFSSQSADVVFPISYSSWAVAFGNSNGNANDVGYPPVFSPMNVTTSGFTAKGDLLGGDGGNHLFDYGVGFYWWSIGV